MNQAVTILKIDNSLSCQNLYSTVLQVSTPYLCLQESDEQVLESGIEECVLFLENNHEYGACTGLTGGFDFHSDKDEKLLRFFDWYSMFSAPLLCNQQDVKERLGQVCEPFAEFAFFGGVIKTTLFLQILEELKNSTFINYDVYKKYILIRALSLGKIQYSSTFYTKFKQRDALVKKKLSWEKQVICNRWMDDFTLLVNQFSDYLFLEQGIPKEITDKLLRDVFFASKQRVYATDYFHYIPLKKRFRNLNYIFSLLEKVVPRKGFLAAQKGLLFLKVHKMTSKPKQQWADISSLVQFLTEQKNHEAR
jgi:hypothetical protein